MFKKILVANRGEIACRIMRTAKKLGIGTVAIYSDADRRALHVEMADEAYHVGPTSAGESYLSIPRILKACLASGAEAVHPGYGFLSEVPTFVEAVEAAGLIFIGPPASAIRAMGLKDAAKTLMERSGVPILPGYHGDDQNPDFLAARAAEIGYPLLIKARAGGGGKGIRRVNDPDTFRAALEGARRESEASFSDGSVLIEKYLTKSRHIEIQVFGDQNGEMVHLFERDCSLQRRHQKVIEEAPAPGVSEDLRKKMGSAAVHAAKAIGYVGAGTVEFIADMSEGDRPNLFFFLEMNTRLQVEHPVTEAITGLDLVEWQFRIAAGEPLPRRQHELRIDGWAFEARIYAESPSKGFLPATGRLVRFDTPSDNVRVDSGVRKGDDITSFYDPMIAKIIVHGETRPAALNSLADALARCRIAGVTTNVAFLAKLCNQPEFASGAIDTGLIDRTLDNLLTEVPVPPEAVAIAALSTLGILAPVTVGNPWQTLKGCRLWMSASQFALIESQGERREVEVVSRIADVYEVSVDGKVLCLEVLEREVNYTRVVFGDRVVVAVTAKNDAVLTVFLDGKTYEFRLPDRLNDVVESIGGDQLIAPTPGRITSVSVVRGARVARSDTLIVMEAMKMEFTLVAPRDGTIKEITVGIGDQVTEGMILLALEAENT